MYRVFSNRRRAPSFDRQHVYTSAFTVKTHHPFRHGIKCEIVAHADIFARVELRSDLAYENIAGDDPFTSESLYAPSLGVGITTVATGTLTLLMCHSTCLLDNCRSSQSRKAPSLTCFTERRSVLLPWVDFRVNFPTSWPRMPGPASWLISIRDQVGRGWRQVLGPTRLPNFLQIQVANLTQPHGALYVSFAFTSYCCLDSIKLDADSDIGSNGDGSAIVKMLQHCSRNLGANCEISHRLPI